MLINPVFAVVISDIGCVNTLISWYNNEHYAGLIVYTKPNGLFVKPVI